MGWHIHQILLFIHILLAIIWVGGILFIGWGVFPTSKSLQPSIQQNFLRNLMQRTHHLFSLAGAVVILTGVLLGTVLGPIHHWEDILHTTYGHIWLTALIVALFTLLWGIFVGYRKSMVMLSKDSIWQEAENGNPKPLQDAMNQTMAFESIEVIGFMIIIICMVLL